MQSTRVMQSMQQAKKISEGSRFVTAMLYALAVLVIIITVYPMYYVVIMSISKPIDVAAKNVYLYPTGFVTSAYEFVMRDNALWRSLGNSVMFAALTTALQLICCVTAGYPLAMPYLPGRKVLVWYLLFPMYFGGGLIPTFIVIAKLLGLYNSIWAVILPGAASVWYIILTRTFFYTAVPTTLREAAMIDGANHYKTLISIYIPLSKPIMAVIAIYTLVNVWNGWFMASVYLTNPKLHPVQLYLKQVLIDDTSTTAGVAAALSPEETAELVRMQMINMQLQYAIIVITTLPVLVVYPFLQKYFVKGVMIGSLKG